MHSHVLIPEHLPVQPFPGDTTGLTEQPVCSAARIDSYDIARAIAVIGMLVVNYFVIFLEFFDGESRFIDLADLLCGRAAALFIMLAGVGLTLLGRKAISSGDKESLRAFRWQILKRCLILYPMGQLLGLYWRADILHFYALFLFVGALLITCSSRVLWLLNLFIFVAATWFFLLAGGDPELNILFNVSDTVSGSVLDLLFSGSYSAFPWFSYLLVGIWFGKNRLTGRNVSLRSLFICSFCTLVVSEVLLRVGSRAGQDDVESWSSLLLLRSAFPISPLYTMSAGASAVLALVSVTVACRIGWLCQMFQPLKYLGRLSLTIYICHIVLAYSMFDFLDNNFTGGDYLDAVIAFFFCSTLFFVIFAREWCRYFTYGPLEWLFRKVSKLNLPMRGGQ